MKTRVGATALQSARKAHYETDIAETWKMRDVR
jgi:hypothetical protein